MPGLLKWKKRCSPVAMRPSRGLVPSPRKSPSKQRSSAHSAAAGEECYELQAVPSVIPALQAISAVRRAGALMARVMSPTADRIEGELWYIAGEYGPGKGNAAAPQWVTCDRHRLVVWSSWCGQGRIIDTVSFDRLRLILNFSHAHTHKVCQRQAPVTRYSAAKNFSLPSARGSRSPPQTFRRGTTTFARKKKLGAIATGRIRAYGGTSMPRYYYFGVEFTCLYRTEDGRNHRRRRVMMFATDVQHDLITWLQFLSDVEVKKVRETVCGGGSQGTKRARKSKQCMSPNVSYFLNESDCTAVDTSNETSLASSSPLDIDTTMDPAVAPSRASDREVEAPGQSIFSLFSSTVTDPTKSPSPQPIEKEQSEEVISNGSLLDISLHNNEPPQLAARPHTPKKKKASLKKVKKKTYEELRNERMMRENTELKRKNEELKKEIKVATDKITELQRNLQASERTNRYAEEECEHLRDSLLKVEKQKANLAKKLSESTGNEFQLQKQAVELHATLEEQAACIRALSEQITAADAYLRDAEGECGSLAGLLGLSPAEDGGDLGTGSAGLSLSNGALRIAERLRLACSAVHDLEQELKASGERERASIEECDRLRNELQKLESQRSDLEESLNAAEIPEQILRGHVDSFLCRVFTSLKCLRDVVAGFAVFMCSDVDVDGSPFLSFGQEGTLEKNIDLSLYRLELLVPTIDVLCRGLVGLCRFYEADRLSLMNGLTGLGVEPGGLVLNSVIPCADARRSLSGTLVDIVSAAGDISVVGDFGGNDNSVAEGGTKSLLQAVGVWQTSVEEFSAEEQCSYSKVVAGIVGGFRDEGIAARRALVNVRKALEGKVPCRDDVIDGNVVASQGSDLETSEGREVVRLIAEQRKSVLFALTSLLSSVSADGVERAMRLSKNVPFSDLVLLLRHECVNVSKAFMSLNAIVQEGSNIAIVTSGESGESSQPGSSVTGFTEVKGDNVVPSKTSAAIENVSSPDLAPSQSAGGEGGKLHTGKGPASASDSAMDSTVASAGICAVDGMPSHSTSLSRCPSVAAEDTDERADLLFSLRDFVEAEEASGKPLAIVQQVREHIHARTEELQQLRTAAVKSVETLSGDPLPAGAKPYDVAGALLAAVKTTSDSIGGVHALLSGVTLEEAPAQATRSLKPKAKPQPVGRCNSSIVLSLKRAVLLNPRLAQAGGRRSRESVQMGLSTASRSAGNRSSVSGNSSSGGGGASVGPQKLHELIKAIESKLKIVQHTRDTCSVCLYLLGDKEGGNVPAEELPTRLLLQAQDLFSGLTQIQNLDLGDEDDEPNADDKSSEGNSLVGKPSWITSRLLKVAKVFRSLQYINESMKQREAVAEKQRSFLLLDVNELRNTHAEEKRRLQDMLEGAKVQLRERDLNIKDMQQQNAILRADYDKACAESKHMTLELNDMRGTLDDLQHWLEGVEMAAGVVRRSSAAVWGQICSVEQKLTERLSAFIPTDHGRYRRTSKTNVEEKMEVSLTARETGGEVELVPVSGGKLVVQLVEDSASCLRQCEESLQLLERPLILVPALSEWIKQQYLSLKDNVSHAEEEVRSILRSCYRSAADLLYDKLRAVQRHREAELELDASHARWQGRLRDIEAAHKEHTAVLNRRLATMWDLTTQQDVLRAETARWQACAEAAAEETERLRVLLRAAESREVPQPTEVVKIIEVEPPRAPKPSTREVSIMTDLLIVEEPAVPDYDEATDVLKIRAELSDALEYAKHQADDAARCHSLMQEQLHLLDGGQGAVVDPSLSLGKLIETHKKRLLMHVDERRKLLEAWQTAQHNISRLKQEIDERERQRKKETRELETQIKELRVRVQRKLEMDMITERQIAEAERSIDREFEELCRRALSGLSVAAHLQQLRSSLMARIRMQMEAQRPRH